MRSFSPDDAPCGLLVVDEVGCIVDANDVFAQWVGANLDQIVGRSLDTFLISEDGSFGRTQRVRHVNGSESPVVCAYKGNGSGRTLVLVDATERALYEAQLVRENSLMERRRSRLELILEASGAFGTAKSEAALAHLLSSTADAAFQADDSVVFLTNDEGQLQLAAGNHPLAGAIPPGSFVTAVAQRGHALTISDADEGDAFDPVIGAAMRARGVQAILAAPIRSDDLLLGVLACFFRRPHGFDEEVAPVAGSLTTQAGQVIKSLRLQSQLEHLAFHDEVTGLANRRLLNAQLMESVRSSHGLIAALLLDLDGFKTVNDTYGHHVGDLLLREVAERLTQTVRQEDLVARYGGDEFVVLSEVRDIAAAHSLAERIRRAISVPYRDLPTGTSIRGSIGMSIAAAEGPTWNPDYLIRVADQAMYAAKAAGGDRTVDVLLNGLQQA